MKRYRVLIGGEDRETYGESPMMAAYWSAIEMNLDGSTIAEVYEYDRPDGCVGVFDVTNDYYGLRPVLKDFDKPNPDVRKITVQ